MYVQFTALFVTKLYDDCARKCVLNIFSAVHLEETIKGTDVCYVDTGCHDVAIKSICLTNGGLNMFILLN